VGSHRHQPEIAEQCGVAAGRMIFVPHLIPVPRGILTTTYLTFDRPLDEADLSTAYDEAYGSTPFVNVAPPGTLPTLRDVVGTPECSIGFRLLASRRQAVIVSVIDNLLKGAASQAIQNFNRVFGLQETEGLL
jgi:N-acetyl-gamma-glutamyl-phosphate reductase